MPKFPRDSNVIRFPTRKARNKNKKCHGNRIGAYRDRARKEVDPQTAAETNLLETLLRLQKSKHRLIWKSQSALAKECKLSRKTVNLILNKWRKQDKILVMGHIKGPRGKRRVWAFMLSCFQDYYDQQKVGHLVSLEYIQRFVLLEEALSMLPEVTLALCNMRLHNSSPKGENTQPAPAPRGAPAEGRLNEDAPASKKYPTHIPGPKLGSLDYFRSLAPSEFRSLDTRSLTDVAYDNWRAIREETRS